MTGKSREELQAFVQKMRNEGAAGFAAGLTPWDSWDNFEERAGSRIWQSTAERLTGQEDPAYSFGDRIVTAMAILAVITLVIGIAGVFLTKHSTLQVADNPAQQLSTGPAMTAEIELPPEEVPAPEEVPVPAAETPANPAAEPSKDQSIERDNRPALATKLAASNQELPARITAAMAVVASPAGQAATGSSTKTLEPDVAQQRVLTALNEQPAPAAGAAEKTSIITSSEPLVKTATNEPAGIPDANTAEARQNIPAPPVRLSEIGTLDVHTELQQTPARNIRQDKPAGKGGDWSINIASYLGNSTAGKKRQQFLDKGVATDLVTATVNGKTYYRLRVTGFESRQTATAESIAIKKKLGLKEVWITKE